MPATAIIVHGASTLKTSRPGRRQVRNSLLYAACGSRFKPLALQAKVPGSTPGCGTSRRADYVSIELRNRYISPKTRSPASWLDARQAVVEVIELSRQILYSIDWSYTFDVYGIGRGRAPFYVQLAQWLVRRPLKARTRVRFSYWVLSA